MSASHKPSLHLTGLTGAIVIGRESKTTPGVLVGETRDVTDTFTGIMLAKFGPEDHGTKSWEFKAPGFVQVEGAEDQLQIKPHDVYRVIIERIPG